MSKRKSAGSELRVNRPQSPEYSSSSSSSSVSYSSSMKINEGRTYAEEENGKAPETKAMALVGCPRCYMYVMLSEVDPKCPKCKSTVFLEFFWEENFKTDTIEENDKKYEKLS